MTHLYDPFDHDLHDDPYPVYRNEESNFCALTRFDDVWDALHDPGTYSGTVALADFVTGGDGVGMKGRRSVVQFRTDTSPFAGLRFPSAVIVLAVRWYLRSGLSYRDLEELLAERGVEVDHVTLFCWVQRFTPLLIDAARPCRHAVGDRWFVDETYVKVAARWRYVYRAVDHYGQVIDVFVSPRRDTTGARRFFRRALSDHGEPAEVVTDARARSTNSHLRCFTTPTSTPTTGSKPTMAD